MTLIATSRRDSAARTMVQRFDRAEATLDPADKMANGMVRMHAAVAVPGVMEYQDADGNITRELIDADELHDVESLKSLASVDVTLEHPDVDVTPDNVSTLGVGDVGEHVQVLEETGHVRVSIVLRRKDALDAVAAGKREVSPGYKCFIDPTPGVHPQFGAYDAIQRHRRYNHLAVVNEARGGETIKLRADSARAVRRVDATTPARPGVAMNPFLLMLASFLSVDTGTKRADGKHVRKDGVEITEEMLASAIQSAIGKLQGEAVTDEDPAVAELKAKIVELQTQLATLQGENTAMKADAQTRADAAAKVAETEERKWLDLLAKADGVKFPTDSWRDEVKNDARKLDLARHMKLVGKDDKPDAAQVHGMVLALKSIHLDSKAGTRSETSERKTDSAWTGTKILDDKLPRDEDRMDAEDAFAVGLKKSRAAARGEKSA